MRPVEIRAKLRELKRQREDAFKLLDEYRTKHRAALHYVQMLESEIVALMAKHPTYKPRKKKDAST